MSITVEEFMKTCTKKQREVLFGLLELTNKERESIEVHNRRIVSLAEEAKSANELTDGQMAKIIRNDADDLSRIATVKEMEELSKIGKEKEKLLVQAVEKYDMGHLGLIQREYARYVGKPLQSKTY